jgi:hypothetical protein
MIPNSPSFHFLQTRVNRGKQPLAFVKNLLHAKILGEFLCHNVGNPIGGIGGTRIFPLLNRINRNRAHQTTNKYS